jgi:hypothetical protein
MGGPNEGRFLKKALALIMTLSMALSLLRDDIDGQRGSHNRE